MVILYLLCLTLSFGLTGEQKTRSEGERGATQMREGAMLGSQGNETPALEVPWPQTAMGTGLCLLTTLRCFCLIVQTRSTSLKVSLPISVPSCHWGCRVGFSATWVSALLLVASPDHPWVPLPSLQSTTVTTRRGGMSCRSLVHTMRLKP